MYMSMMFNGLANIIDEIFDLLAGIILFLVGALTIPVVIILLAVVGYSLVTGDHQLLGPIFRLVGADG